MYSLESIQFMRILYNAQDLYCKDRIIHGFEQMVVQKKV